MRKIHIFSPSFPILRKFGDKIRIFLKNVVSIFTTKPIQENRKYPTMNVSILRARQFSLGPEWADVAVLGCNIPDVSNTLFKKCSQQNYHNFSENRKKKDFQGSYGLRFFVATLCTLILCKIWTWWFFYMLRKSVNSQVGRIFACTTVYLSI